MSSPGDGAGNASRQIKSAAILCGGCWSTATALTHRRVPDQCHSASGTERTMSSPGDGACNASRQITSVAILCAMSAEAQPMVDHLGLKADKLSAFPAQSPVTSWSGSYAGLNVHVIHNGVSARYSVDNVGTAAAALAAFQALTAFHPDLVISIGTAGGFKARGAQIGDVFVGTQTLNHDRRIAIPGFDKYGVGSLACVPTPNLQQALKLKAGSVSSGNSLDYTTEDFAAMSQTETAIKEMEAAAIAWVADMFGTPMFCLKSVTDIVDGDKPPEQEFLENLQRAASALQAVIQPVLEFVAGKTSDQL